MHPAGASAGAEAMSCMLFYCESLACQCWLPVLCPLHSIADLLAPQHPYLPVSAHNADAQLLSRSLHPYLPVSARNADAEGMQHEGQCALLLPAAGTIPS